MPRPLSDANIRAIEAVDKIASDMPASLKKMLEREGIILDKLPDRVSSKKALEKRMESLGVFEQAKKWRQEFAKSCRLCFPGKTWLIAREIAWRVWEHKASVSLDEWQIAANLGAAKNVDVDPDVERLPKDIRWVYQHPYLAAPGKPSPALQAAAKEYEAEHPCPNNGARSRLNSVTRTAKAADEFFKHVDKLLVGTRQKRTGTGGGAGPRESAEEESIADLESRLFEQMSEQAIGEKAAVDGDDFD